MRAEWTARVGELTRSRVPFVHATVVRAAHPTSAHAGDTALVHADGEIEGFVGGTCAETSVRVHALEVLSSGEPRLLRIRPDGDDDQVVEEGAVTVTNPCLSGGTLEIFLEPHRPAPRVVVVGATPVAHALAALGGPLGLHVEPVAGGPVDPSPDDAALIVASHGRGEEPALEAALRAGVPYVALVASRVRGTAVLASLQVSEEQRGQVHSPAGLDLGARTAAEIALSILAELIALRPSVGPAAGPATGVAGSAAGAAGSAAGVARPVTGLDPVCGMTVAVTPGALQLSAGGRTVYFCGEHCRAAYAGDPGRYAATS